MQVRWFALLFLLAASACGENQVAQKGEKVIRGRPAHKDQQDSPALLARRA